MSNRAPAVFLYAIFLYLMLCSCSSASPKASESVFPDPALDPLKYPQDMAAAPQPEKKLPPTELPPPAPAVQNQPVPQNSPVSPVPPAPPAPPADAAPAPVQEPRPERDPAPERQNKAKPKAAVKKAIPVKPAKPAAQTGQLTLAQLVRKYPDLLRLKGSSRSKQIALTFDDAPDTTYTPQVLDILKKNQVHATFFLLGVQAAKHPDMVRRIAREGHIIGNHSYNHKLFTKLSDDLFRAQVQDTQKTLKRLIGYSPRLLRPPYGEISESQLLWASESGFTIVNWNVDSLDWKQLDASHVTSNILDHMRPGSIVLQHSGGGPEQNLSGTVQALPSVISTLKKRGYKFVTLPELLQVSKEL